MNTILPSATLYLLLACLISAPAMCAPSKATTQAATQDEAKTADFNRTLSLQGITFQISTPNIGSINALLIQPSGLKGKNEPIQREIEGTVTDAEVADLNMDGAPELYIYVTSAGSGSYGSLIAYASNRNKSLTEIYLPPLQDNPKAAKGYMGHDEFRIVESSLVRRFPIYRETDTNSRASGGMRQIQYKLKPGEAGWILRLFRIYDF